MFEGFANTELLVSHKGIDWPDGFDNHPFVDISAVPDRDYRLLILMLSQNGRTIRPELKYGMNGIMQALHPNANEAISKIWKLGYFRESTNEEALASFTIPRILEVAEKLGINVNKRAKKPELLAVVLPHASSPIIAKTLGEHHIFKLSESGYLMARSLYEERKTVETLVYNSLLDGDGVRAAMIWSEYKSRQFGEKVTFQSNLISMQISDKVQAALLGCKELFGQSPMFFPIELPQAWAIYEWQKLNSQQSLNSLKDASISKYRIHACYDHSTCKICVSNDGSTHKVENAAIGKNCPPFHEGCRCFSAAVLDGMKRETTKASRNPLTNASTYTTATTYREWEQTLTENEKAALYEKRGW